jgi:hypothetical protein
MAKSKISTEGFTCERCNHDWVPRSLDKPPKICPRCRSSYWNKSRKDQEAKGSSSKLNESKQSQQNFHLKMPSKRFNTSPPGRFR